jgi:hypothetical protein
MVPQVAALTSCTLPLNAFIPKTPALQPQNSDLLLAQAWIASAICL